MPILNELDQVELSAAGEEVELEKDEPEHIC